MRLHAYCINTGVGATSTCQLLERLDHILILLVIDGFSTPLLLGHSQAFRETINGNYLLRTQHIRALNGKLTNWPAAPDSDDLPGLNLAVFSRHVASREDV